LTEFKVSCEFNDIVFQITRPGAIAAKDPWGSFLREDEISQNLCNINTSCYREVKRGPESYLFERAPKSKKAKPAPTADAEDKGDTEMKP